MTDSINQFELKVDWMAKVSIERFMLKFIQRFQQWNGINQLARCEGVQPVKYLEYLRETDQLTDFGYLNLEEEYGQDALGICDFSNNAIYLDHRLEKGGEFEAKHSFTAAHELAHWILHRPFYLRLTETPSMFGDTVVPSAYRIVCRNSIIGQFKNITNNFSRIEWQADYGAACVLLPSELIRKQYMVFNQRQQISKQAQDGKRIGDVASTASLLKQLVAPPSLEPALNSDFIEYIARIFHCSRMAAEIRIKELKLI